MMANLLIDQFGSERPDAVMLDPGASSFLAGYQLAYVSHLEFIGYPDQIQFSRCAKNAARSFNPSTATMTVRSTEGRETLLKLALPAPQGSGNAAGRLTRRGRPAAVRQLDDFLAPPRPRTLD